jgi:hypothetical protein
MKVLCVGGPMHGVRREVIVGSIGCNTLGGPEREWMLHHTYLLRRYVTPDGRVLRAFVWQIIPRWTRAGFNKVRE